MNSAIQWGQNWGMRSMWRGIAVSLWRYQVTFESFRANGTVPSGSSDAAFQVHAIGTGVRHELTPTLAVDAGLGYSFTTSDAPAERRPRWRHWERQSHQNLQ